LMPQQHRACKDQPQQVEIVVTQAPAALSTRLFDLCAVDRNLG
jgi:hypothetical protein